MQDLAPASLPPGTEVGSWRVLERRGRGNYGAVYRVERIGNPGAGPFALKLATHPLDPRFEREAEMLSLIHHPVAVPYTHL
ncbi:serine/threonine protein kinase, partial [Pyxidicoccus fallax]|nr:serine/threonine protein kinase [Pyxidicoccus fallax]